MYRKYLLRNRVDGDARKCRAEVWTAQCALTAPRVGTGHRAPRWHARRSPPKRHAREHAFQRTKCPARLGQTVNLGVKFVTFCSFVWRFLAVLKRCQAHGTSRNIPSMATLGLRCFARRDNKPTAKPRCTRQISSRSVDHELYGKDKDSCTLDQL